MKYIKYLATLLFAFTSNLVFAQADVFAPSKDDVMMKIIGQLFGGIMPGGGKDAFGTAISTFNGAILIIGGILATYTLLAGTLGTAHDGEMLGKKFSSAWIPIRYGLGTALILPVVNGYAVIQKLMMWIIIQGIGLGGMIWSSYMDTPYQQANTVVQESTKYDVLNNAEKIFLEQVCIQSNAKSLKNADSILDLFSKYDYSMAFDSSTNTYNFGDQNGSILGAGTDVCGSVKLADPIPNTTVATGPSTSNTGYLGPLDNLFSPADISGINTAHKTATTALITSMGTLAGDVIKADKMDNSQAKAFYAQIKTAADTYVTTIKASADAAQTQKQVSDKAHDYGFALAGAYFMNIIVTNNKITTAIGNIPVVSAKVHNRSADAEAMTSLGTKVLAAGNTSYSAGAQAQQKDAENKDVDMSWDAKLVNAITKYFTHLDFYNLKNDARHPVIILADMGNTLTDAYVHLLMAVLGISVAGGAIAGIIGTISPMGAVITGTISNAILTTLGFLAVPLMMVLGSAFLASYLIPMMVFIMWIGILVGYCLAVVIAVIISPLWMAMHLHPNGDDLTGKGGSGYMMVLNMLLKPSFMIFGFIASIVLSSVLGEFINKIYFQVFSYSQGDGNGLMGFMKTVFGTAIYIGLMFMFIKKCFSLMGLFSDEIFKWIGGHSANLGGHAEHMQAGTNSAAAQAASFLGTKAVADRMQNAGKSIANNIKDKAKAKQELADKAKNGKPKDDPNKPVDDSKKSYGDLTREKNQAQDGSGADGSSPADGQQSIADSKPNSPSESQGNPGVPGAADTKASDGDKTIPDARNHSPIDSINQAIATTASNAGDAAAAAASGEIQPGQAQEQSIPDTTGSQEQVRTSEAVIPPATEPTPPAMKPADHAAPKSDFEQNMPSQTPKADDKPMKDEN
ncbi:DotA/TraY family protein [Serratia marcescens]|uniref:DotA/TraY family protein n=1 Tax=Serratia marcescens TaxID=615 RepID=UPI001F152A03|nr:DotA/TraY family protein [Serratia marcescens]